MTSPYNNPNQPGFGIPGGGADVNRMHDYDDLDVSPLSHHHSLGIQPGQATAGDHIHDGKLSKKISMDNLTDYKRANFTPTPFGGVNAFNAGVAQGKYQKYGHLITVQMKITFSATTTYNAGVAIQVPLPSDWPLRINSMDTLLSARLLDTSAGQVYTGVAIIDFATDILNIQRLNFGSPATGMTSTVPITLASGDTLWVSGVYETGPG